jgi:Fe-Mn family superoxide dismutase
MNLKIVDILREGLKDKNNSQVADFKPVKLGYKYDELKEFIDSETMDIHYNKHYKGYVKKLNELLKEKGFKLKKDDGIISLISRVNGLGKKIKNQAGGVYNHEFFWEIMTPDKEKRIFDGEIKKIIENQYGSLEKFIEEFSNESKSKFGSGWCWAILKSNNRIKIMTTSNQDNPKMNIFLTKDKNEEGNIIYKPITGKIILGLDLWEHSYYLKYRNKRDDYIKNFWKVVNWKYINDLIKKES